MKRVLCILSSMNAGGAETFLMKIYRKLDRTKYQMDFCVNVKENYYAEEIKSLGGKLYVIPTKSESISAFKKALSDVIKENGYRYVLRVSCHGMGMMDIKVAKKSGAEVLAVRSSNSNEGSGIVSRFTHLFGKLLYGKYVNVKFAPSDLAAKYTFGKKAYESGEVAMLHNAIDLSLFHYTEKERNEIREEFNIKNDFVVGHIGRFDTQKNHSFLLDVFAEILKQKPNAKLMLVGKGVLEKEIKEKAEALGISDKIIFTGVRSDVPALLSAMDVFVFPSLYEGMPNTVIEAQSTGLPCIISDTITKEADITGLVEYLPLNVAPSIWAQKAVAAGDKPRKDTKQDFIDNKYDIESSVKEFVKLIFGEVT